MTAIVARLELIDGTGSYLTEIGTRVEDSRPNWDENELPAISVFQGTATTERTDDEEVEVMRKFPVMIRCVFQRDDDQATDAAFARKTISDIYRAIRSNDQWIVSSVPQATFTQEKSHGIEYAENSYEITGVQVEIEIQYIGSKFNLES